LIACITSLIQVNVLSQRKLTKYCLKTGNIRTESKNFYWRFVSVIKDSEFEDYLRKINNTTFTKALTQKISLNLISLISSATHSSQGRTTSFLSRNTNKIKNTT